MLGLREKDIGGRRREKGGSLGNLEEMFKRKRKSGEETTGEEVFRSSKKTLRSPGKGEGGEREEIGEMMRKWRRS